MDVSSIEASVKETGELGRVSCVEKRGIRNNRMIEMKRSAGRNEEKEGRPRGCDESQLWLCRISTPRSLEQWPRYAASYHEYLACETEWLRLNSATRRDLTPRSTKKDAFLLNWSFVC